MSIVHNNKEIKERFLGAREVDQVFNGIRLVWQKGTAPVINSFSANPSSVDLDSPPQVQLRLSFDVTSSTRNTLRNQRTGQNIPLVDNTHAITSIPELSTNYELTCRNEYGTTTRIVNVPVTKNPLLTNLRRVGFAQVPQSNSYLYRFGVTVSGLPRPFVRWNMSTGENGTIPHNLFQQGANSNTWTIQWSVTLGTSATRSLTLTAGNGSGQVTDILTDINASG